MLGSGLILLAAGCATTASLKHYQPARTGTAPRRLVLLDVSGPEDGRLPAQLALERELRRAGIYELAKERDLQPAAPAPLRWPDGGWDMPTVLTAARRIGAEGILAAQLRFVDPPGAAPLTAAKRGSEFEPAAQMQYTVWDVSSGQITISDTVTSELYQGQHDSGTPGPSGDSAVLGKLAAACGADVAQALAPHEATVEVVLATQAWGAGASDLRRGNRAAAADDWAEALRHWSSAILADNGNAAAWYNLGLAHEALGQFEHAKSAYTRADSLQEDEQYRAALARVEEAEALFQLAVAQRLRSLARLAEATRTR